MQFKSVSNSPEQHCGPEDKSSLVKEESQCVARFRSEVHMEDSRTLYRAAYESMQGKMDFDGNGALSNLELKVGLDTAVKSAHLTDLERRLGASLVSNAGTVEYICPGFRERGLVANNFDSLSDLKRSGAGGVLASKVALYSATFGSFGMIGGLGVAMLTGVGRTGALTQAGLGLAIGIAASAGLAYHEYSGRKSELEQLIRELP
jgi:hypothetical protein